MSEDQERHEEQDDERNVTMALGRLERNEVLTSTGMRLPANITYARYATIGGLLGSVSSSIQWAIGDWLVQGEALFGEEAAQAAEALWISPASLQQYARVASRIPYEEREKELTWSHHRVLVSLEPAERKKWLARALKNGWSSGELSMHYSDSVRGAPPQVPRSYVLERVADAAEQVARQARHGTNGNDGAYVVPEEPMEQLITALGIEPEEPAG